MGYGCVSKKSYLFRQSRQERADRWRKPW